MSPTPPDAKLNVFFSLAMASVLSFLFLAPLRQFWTVVDCQLAEPRPSTASPLHPGAQLEWLLRLCTPSGNDTKLGQSQISKRERDV
uniref:Uncharacterized protein n=1 Tax=Salix viminalis TaxID=40686 RepID=A0A6N2LPT2_SALVM